MSRRRRLRAHDPLRPRGYPRKALAHPSRRELLDRLHRENGQNLGQLGEGLDMTRQAVTKHLALLEAANLVVRIRRGRELLHYLNPVPINGIYERWIGKYERRRLQALSDLKKGLEAPRGRNRVSRGSRDGQAAIRLRHLHRHRA
ncbi:MAG: ArsR/SmtB family transcription factor [Candidatus Rokuibacteriota bacterium]